VTFDEIAGKLRDANHEISTSSLRRHFRHVPAIADSAIPTGESELRTSIQDVPTAFDGLVGGPVNERMLLEASAKALIEKLQIAEREYKAVAGRCPQAEQKALARFDKLQTALARSMKQLRDARRLREEMNTIIVKIGEAVGDAVCEGGREFMLNRVGLLRESFDAYLAGKVSEIVLVRKLEQFEREWSAALGQTLAEAVAAKLGEVGEFREWMKVA
jgi:hypothetical protein